MMGEFKKKRKSASGWETTAPVVPSVRVALEVLWGFFLEIQMKMCNLSFSFSFSIVLLITVSEPICLLASVPLWDRSKWFH